MNDEPTTLRDKIIEAYMIGGAPPEAAGQFVDAAFRVHEIIEQARTDAVLNVASQMTNATVGSQFMLLVVQLEIMHLQGVMHALSGELGIPPATLQ